MLDKQFKLECKIQNSTMQALKANLTLKMKIKVTNFQNHMRQLDENSECLNLKMQTKILYVSRLFDPVDQSQGHQVWNSLRPLCDQHMVQVLR